MRTRKHNNRLQALNIIVKGALALLLLYATILLSTLVHDQKYIMQEDQDLLNMGRQMEEITQHIRICQENVEADCWAEVEADGDYEILWRAE